jgi:IS5 family transposase
LQRAVDDLTELLTATRTIAAQTRQRLAGITPDGATRRVSLHDSAARPIAKGRLGRPVEFGYKGQVLDNDDGVVLDHTLDEGNPPDAPQLAPAVARVIARTGRRPRAVTADRGYGEARVENDLHDLGVRTVVIPRKGRARQATEHRPTFRKIVKWRTGCEGRISSLKRGLRLGPRPTRRPRRSPHLDRTGRSRPQPRQDRRPGRLTNPRPNTFQPEQDRPPHQPGEFFRSK